MPVARFLVFFFSHSYQQHRQGNTDQSLMYTSEQVFRTGTVNDVNFMLCFTTECNGFAFKLENYWFYNKKSHFVYFSAGVKILKQDQIKSIIPSLKPKLQPITAQWFQSEHPWLQSEPPRLQEWQPRPPRLPLAFRLLSLLTVESCPFQKRILFRRYTIHWKIKTIYSVYLSNHLFNNLSCVTV